MDIRLAGSADSGAAWAPHPVNNDGTLADQFNPAITIDSGSNVYISFQDTRLSSTFQASDTFLATSSGGNPFDNQRISTASSNDSKTNLTRDITANLGDRTAIALAANNVVVAWTDTRLGSGDVFLSVMAGEQTARPTRRPSKPAAEKFQGPLLRVTRIPATPTATAT